MRSSDGDRGLREEAGIAEAQEALEACARAVLAGRQQGPLLAAFKLVSIMWDGAPLAKRFGKNRPESADTLSQNFSNACGDWLPFAEDLGASRFQLIKNGSPTQFCKLMAMPRKR